MIGIEKDEINMNNLERIEPFNYKRIYTGIMLNNLITPFR